MGIQTIHHPNSRQCISGLTRRRSLGSSQLHSSLKISSPPASNYSNNAPPVCLRQFTLHRPAHTIKLSGAKHQHIHSQSTHQRQYKNTNIRYTRTRHSDYSSSFTSPTTPQVLPEIPPSLPPSLPPQPQQRTNTTGTKEKGIWHKGWGCKGVQMDEWMDGWWYRCTNG